ncbi:hypothetical protein XBJ1_0159 [Xenorhabdus bovienii SS-2004]|uniref:Uncharacterized protein n=1 Tax=Xenorhabdus bovienii (strain SS-2004) TaxID=406818 RepID=D3UYD2_XENBS|nr:hypothetical protein XBJ1_0159 [Xenorhabdus bovienii SS-2004]
MENVAARLPIEKIIIVVSITPFRDHLVVTAVRNGAPMVAPTA